MAKSPYTTPLRIVSGKDYYVEVSSDDDQHYVRVAEFDNFDQALGEFNRLINGGEADMRVTMRRRAHIFEHFIPKRLRSPSDRRE
jgi:hypothetical protein